MGTEEVDAIVIGAGVVGLACALELTKEFGSVVLVEREGGPGREISSRNSGVIHAGIYYPGDSLKTQLCIEGRERLYAWCDTHDVPHENTGKLIVATSAEDETRLRALAKHAHAVGAGKLEALSGAEAKAREPELRCESALYSPRSGVVDVHEFLASLLKAFREAGGAVAFRTEVQAITRHGRSWVVQTTDALGGATEIETSRLVNAAGFGSIEVAKASGLAGDECPWQLYPCKGSYFSLQAGAPPTRHSLIYPLPQAAGLGVHITADLSGARRAGPDAEYIDEVEYDVDASRRMRFTEAVARYLPAIEPEHLAPDYAGVRPKLVGPPGGFADFVVTTPKTQPGLVHLIGIESPGLTAALAIGAHVSMLLR
ncbi:MAG: NAD(P)/FAD-dependent oxidoreductase [Myxococcota bacterium]